MDISVVILIVGAALVIMYFLLKIPSGDEKSTSGLQMTLKIRFAIVLMCQGIARADGMDNAELDYLSKLALELGLDPVECQEQSDLFWTERPESFGLGSTLASMTEKQKDYLADKIIEVVMADGHVSQEEVLIIIELIQGFGLPVSMAKDLTDRIRVNI